jgi:putative spermidine/putrescine transport system ATP-binding protein
VGTLNTIDATVREDGGLGIGGQVLSAERPVDAAAGTSVRLAIRPEMLQIGGPGIREPHLRGALRDVAFLGSVVRLRIRLEDGVTDIHVDEFNTPALRVPDVGEAVAIVVPPAAVLVLGGTTGP